VLLIKTSAFSRNNNCVIIDMHGRTTLKTLYLQTANEFEFRLTSVRMRQVSIVTVPRPWGQQPQQTRSQAVDKYVVRMLR
jgi:hypothetical protein